jgi:hypothetical protein
MKANLENRVVPTGYGRRPTQRAADGGYAARFLSIFVALSFFRFDGESTHPPTAAKAHRWAPVSNQKGYWYCYEIYDSRSNKCARPSAESTAVH